MVKIDWDKIREYNERRVQLKRDNPGALPYRGQPGNWAKPAKDEPEYYLEGWDKDDDEEKV
jgi:hypothetical protein